MSRTVPLLPCRELDDVVPFSIARSPRWWEHIEAAAGIREDLRSLAT